MFHHLFRNAHVGRPRHWTWERQTEINFETCCLRSITDIIVFSHFYFFLLQTVMMNDALTVFSSPPSFPPKFPWLPAATLDLGEKENNNTLLRRASQQSPDIAVHGWLAREKKEKI